MNKKKTVSRAWVITLESHKKTKNKHNVVSVLKYQKSESQIMEHISQLYIDSLCPSDQISFLKNKYHEGLSCKPRPITKNGRFFVTIGHEPHFFARQVTNLIENPADPKKFIWDKED